MLMKNDTLAELKWTMPLSKAYADKVLFALRMNVGLALFQFTLPGESESDIIAFDSSKYVANPSGHARQGS
jgi:hypothetical protein